MNDAAAIYMDRAQCQHFQWHVQDRRAEPRPPASEQLPNSDMDQIPSAHRQGRSNLRYIVPPTATPTFGFQNFYPHTGFLADDPAYRTDSPASARKDASSPAGLSCGRATARSLDDPDDVKAELLGRIIEIAGH